MPKLRSLYRRIEWLALFAVLVHAFVPFAAGVLAASAEEGYVEVCSARGVRLVRIDEVPDRPAGEQSADAATCPLCAIHACSPLLPTQAAFVVPSERSRPAQPRRYLVFFVPPVPHAIARPRDPPVFA